MKMLTQSLSPDFHLESGFVLSVMQSGLFLMLPSVFTWKKLVITYHHDLALRFSDVPNDTVPPAMHRTSSSKASPTLSIIVSTGPSYEIWFPWLLQV